ncbi:monocarboxylate transporter 13-like [Scyliorhinus canicula]|uniref:monocarboxylate transporter 13-like n=1 Tax=Scyliorhinus canicula TaxID=7830 RepID=UPI0018F7492A|nr:monocarboxylate transporter 13-like [Scyliorhinus canicula]
MAKPVCREPPDGGWGWMVVLAGFMKICLTFGIVRSFGVFFVQFIEHFDKSSSQVSWIGSILLATQQFGCPLGSIFGAHYGARPVVMVGGVFACLGMLTASFGQSLLHLYLSAGFLTGFGWALAFSPTVSMIAKYFKKRRALATGLAFTGVGISSFFFPPLFQLLIDVYGWRGALQIVSAMMLNLCVSGALLRPITLFEDLPVASAGHPDDGEKNTKCWGKVVSTLDLTLFLHRGFMVYNLSATLLAMGFFVPYIHLLAHGKDLGLSDYEVAFLMSATAIADTVARLFSGWVADFRLIRKIHMVFLWSLFTGISLVIIPTGRSYTSTMGLCIFYGFCAGGLPALLFATITDIVGIGRILNATGLFMVFMSIGSLLGPPLSGFLRDRTGNFALSFMTASGFIFAGCAVHLFSPGFFVRKSVLPGEEMAGPAGRSRKELDEEGPVLEKEATISDADLGRRLSWTVAETLESNF